jgi:predicted HicB family RNase H-like nuclease
MDNMEYKGYYGSVEYSREDNSLFGKVLGMSKDVITYEGSTIEELKADFEAGIDSYIEGCDELGIKPRKSFSGAFNIRIPSETHCQIAVLAEKSGVSINALVKNILEERVKAIQ